MAKQNLPVQKLNLLQPSLGELSSVLENALKNSFEEVAVNEVECPNLEIEPFYLAGKGLCGHPKLIDVGGVKNLQPIPDKTKIYNLDELVQLIQSAGSFLIGAGAGPFHTLGCNCEFMANIRTKKEDDIGNNLSYMAKVGYNGGDHCELLQMPENRECSLMLNGFVSDGQPGKVIEVRAKRRTRDTNLISAMREAVKNFYREQPVGIGGVFLIQSGKAKLHVMPDFPDSPLTDAVIDEWLKFYEMNAPLVCLSTFVSHDPNLDLRVEHTHCFSKHGQGGHYHHDTTPDQVEYLGYFLPAEELYRIDKPEKNDLGEEFSYFKQN